MRCPSCHAELKREGKAFRCRNGHSFDVARQGYVNLLVNARRETGDNKEMVSARTAFLEQGHYRCLRDALCEIIRSLPVQVIADCGCGEGYYAGGRRRGEGRLCVRHEQIRADEMCASPSGHPCLCGQHL